MTTPMPSIREQLSSAPAPRPSIRAWTCGVLTTAVVATLALTLAIVAHEATRPLAVDISYPLLSRTAAEVQRALIPAFAEQRAVRDEVTSARGLVLSLLRTDPGAAEAIITRLQNRVAATSAPVTDLAGPFESLMEQILLLKETTAKRATTLNALRQIIPTSADLVSKVHELQRRLHDELAIIGEPPPPTLDATRFYTTGILRGVPTIPEIADGIATIGALAEAARRAGSTLRVRTEAEYDALEEALDTLRTAASALPDRLSNLNAEHARLVTERDSLARELQERMTAATAAFDRWVEAVPRERSFWDALKWRLSASNG